MLEGKVAVVTGGARGIGLATTQRMLQAGASVSVWDLERTPEIGALAEDFGDRLDFRRVDLRSAKLGEHAAAACAARFGGIDVLVNNAGATFGFRSLEDTTIEVLQALAGTNLGLTVNATQAVLPHFEGRTAGRIINTTSVLGRFGVAGQTAYAAAKSAVVGITRVWAQELGPRGITVNAVSPGYIRTRMNAENTPELEQGVLARTPVRRLGEPEDVAAVTAFLASDAASFINGAIIPVDGGFIP